MSLFFKKSITLNLLIKYILPGFCIILLCHSGSLNLLGKYFGLIYQEKIENHYIGDTAPLFDGNIRFKNAVAQNIQNFLKHDPGIKFFNLKLNILITSKNGEVVYPYYDPSIPDVKDRNRFWDSTAIAMENFNLLHEKRKVVVVTRIGYISPGSCLILVLYLITGFIIFGVIIRTREKNFQKYPFQGEIIQKFKEKEQKLKKEEQKLKKDHEISSKALKHLEIQRRDLIEKLDTAKTEQSRELRKARINEDQMICEIDSLEKKLNKNIALQKAKEQEMHNLRKQVAKYERRKGRGGKRGTFDLAAKRFAVLYKNVDMNRKALTGLLDLNDNQQIKAEEIILQLDRNADGIRIKRKVFSGKKDKNTFFEVLFAYNGRLYFRNLKGKRVEIVTIGTKNTQSRDMEFLHQF